MKPLTPYLFFNGSCQEAMNFYQNCFGGNLEVMTYADAPENACPEGFSPKKDAVMHACLSKDDFTLMASDNPENKTSMGDNIALTINCTSVEQTNQIFKALSKDGKVTMPLSNTFWGAYFGMLRDKYGFMWMLSCPLEK